MGYDRVICTRDRSVSSFIFAFIACDAMDVPSGDAHCLTAANHFVFVTGETAEETSRAKVAGSAK